MAKIRLVPRMIIDLVTILLLGAIFLTFTLALTPHERGFFVEDDSIRLPYRADTIPSIVVVVVGFAVNIVVILALEVWREGGAAARAQPERHVSGVRVPGWACRACVALEALLLGALTSHCTVQLVKCVVGRLRPNFYDVCQPVFNASSPLNQLGYIQDYSCAGTNAKALKEMRLSFPSGHSSFAMYSCLFLILYIEQRSRLRRLRVPRHSAQFLLLLAALYAGLSRVVDHMHHPTDVVAGLLNGGGHAVLAIVLLVKQRKDLFSKSDISTVHRSGPEVTMS